MSRSSPAETLSKDAGDAASRPSRPDFASIGPPRTNLRSRLSRLVRRRILDAIDAGRWGLTPLETHVVICGFPRSGTTLLQLMMASCIGGARTFRLERRAHYVAEYALRNHALMISKTPSDLFWIDEIRQQYAGRQSTVRFIVLTRDPRDVLTSHHRNRPGQYYMTPQRWRAFFDHYSYACRFSDVLAVRFEDLVGRTAEVEQKICDFISRRPQRPFSRFHEVRVKGFDTSALNGVRALETSNIGRWRESRHTQRMHQLLDELPQLPEWLIAMGYEPDTQWVQSLS